MCVRVISAAAKPALCGIALMAASPSLSAEPTLNFSGDALLRYDFIDQSILPQTSEALTLSGRLAGELNVNPRLSILAEVEAVGAAIDDFDASPLPPNERPLLPDPDHFDLNRLQVQAKLSDGAFLTLGRQSLRIDDQRFLGVAGFRQNRRSFDAARLSVRSNGSHTFQFGYIDKVHRPLGNRSPLGEFDSESWFGNANVQTPIGRVGVFHYALDLETGPNWNRNRALSSATTGVRYDARFHQQAIKLDVEASYAHQTDHADNPLSYSADYWLLDVRAFLGTFEVNARVETLGNGEEQAFQTPLASLHKFQGEADVFLSTPADGLTDYSVGLKFNGGTIGPFKDITPTFVAHRFEADRGGATYGSEIDFTVRAKLADLSLSLGLADYQADTFSSDRRRIFLAIWKRF